MKTFKQKWNLKTLRKIRAEYSSSDAEFLCHGSDTFRELWHDHKNEITLLADRYNKAAATPVFTSFHREVLFYTHKAQLDPRTLRLAWLDHEISKRTRKRRPAK